MDKKKVIWCVIFVLLAVLTIYAITSQSDNFSFSGFVSYIGDANFWWITAAFLCMICYITLEGLSIRYITSFLGYKKSIRRSFVYSSANLYFSAITPSATGGQPASAYFMIKDGISASVTAMALLINITMYTVSIIVLCAICILIKPGVFMGYNNFSKLLIIIGFLIQSACVAVFLMLVYTEQVLYRIVDGLLHFLARLHLVKNVEKKQGRLKSLAAEYKTCCQSVKGHADVVVKVFLFNIFQRFIQACITLCVYIGVGGDIKNSATVIVTQALVLLGSNAVPIPGAIGVADYLFIDGFAALYSGDIISIELLSRGISFYSCMILCGGVVLLSLIIGKYKNRQIRGAENG